MLGVRVDLAAMRRTWRRFIATLRRSSHRIIGCTMPRLCGLTTPLSKLNH